MVRGGGGEGITGCWYFVWGSKSRRPAAVLEYRGRGKRHSQSVAGGSLEAPRST